MRAYANLRFAARKPGREPGIRQAFHGPSRSENGKPGSCPDFLSKTIRRPPDPDPAFQGRDFEGVTLATYRLSVSTVSRSTGRSVVAAVAYQHAIRLEHRAPERESGGEGAMVAKIHDYSRKSGVLDRFLFVPRGAPDWARDRQALWNAAEAAETRRNSVTGRQIQLSLPHELELADWRILTRRFAEKVSRKHGVAVDIAIHAADRHADPRNVHAHLMLTTRRLTKDGFTEKTRELDDRKSGAVEALRALWADLLNERLQERGITSVDHRSYERQGQDREPQPKLGPLSHAMEQRGVKTRRGDALRAWKARDRQRRAQQAAAERARKAQEAAQRARQEAPRPQKPAMQLQAAWIHAAPARGWTWIHAGQARQAEQAKAAAARSQEAGKERGADAAQAQDLRKIAFEEAKTRAQNALQSRHHDALGRLGESHQRRRDGLEQTIEDAYGQHRRQLERRLAEIEAKTRKSGVLAQLANRLKGLDTERTEIRATLENIAQRTAEMRQPVERALADERQDMVEDHARQRRALRRDFEEGEKRGYTIPERYRAPGRDDGTARDPAGKPDRGRSRGRGGLER